MALRYAKTHLLEGRIGVICVAAYSGSSVQGHRLASAISIGGWWCSPGVFPKSSEPPSIDDGPSLSPCTHTSGPSLLHDNLSLHHGGPYPASVGLSLEIVGPSIQKGTPHYTENHLPHASTDCDSGLPASSSVSTHSDVVLVNVPLAEDHGFVSSIGVVTEFSAGRDSPPDAKAGLRMKKVGCVRRK
ncbi:hypothetical protein Salat_2107800 [Sesamum alatum]|uniref:Uncharacterized protein n=1 Tax=Sesamum alatum TaxID=300844 RepID=A0AAE1Y1K8_9LAMI|nr:hypothetical protein Salat_2107800 [Sesamum alatum]